MGRTKHGSNSARTKSSANYKTSGRRAINKAKKQQKIAEGKKIKSRKTPKTMDMIWDTLIRNVRYDPEEEKEYIKNNKIYLKPKNVNKNCVR